MNKADLEGINTVVSKMRDLEIEKNHYSNLIREMEVQFGTKAHDPNTDAQVKIILKTTSSSTVSVSVYDLIQILKKSEEKLNNRILKCQNYFSSIQVVFADSKK